MNQFLKENWPLIAVAATGLIAWGATTADISQLKREADKARVNGELLIEVRTEQRTMKEDVREIKDAVKKIAEDRRR